jgi:hypothetical protein
MVNVDCKHNIENNKLQLKSNDQGKWRELPWTD